MQWGGGKIFEYQLNINSFAQIFFSQGLCWVAVPTFFLISGYLFYNGLQEWDYKRWYKKLEKRIYSLLIPYLLWNLIAFLIFYLVQMLKANSVIGLFDFFRTNGLHFLWDSHNNKPMDFPLWFVRDLIVAVLFSPFVYWLVKKMNSIPIIILGVLAVCDVRVPGLNISFLSLYFFSLGCYVCLLKLDLHDFCSKYEITSYSLTLLLCILMVLFYGCPPIWKIAHHMLQLIAPFAVISLSYHLSNTIVRNIGLRLSRTSFFIFAVHGIYVVLVFQKLFTRLLVSNGSFALLIAYISTIVCTLASCLILYFVLNKTIPRTLKILCGSRV